jgi:hypothetical protein
MTIPVRLESRAEAWPGRVSLLKSALLPEITTDRTSTTRAQLSTAELAFRVFAAFRAHPHINNVLTHISHSNWSQVERSLNVILDPEKNEELSPLAQNIVDLMFAERGVTGKLLKPHLHGALEKLVDRHRAERLIRHIEALFIEMERKTKHPPAASIEPIQGHSP